MASSQVEIVPPSHFGCILKEHNHNDRRKDTKSNNINQNSQITLKKNLNEFVRDQFQTCVTTSESYNIKGSRKFHYQGIDFECWSSKDKKGSDEDASYRMYKRQSRVIDEWATQQAKDMMDSKEEENDDDDLEFMSLPKSGSGSISSRESSFIREPSPSPSDNSSTDFSVSSLVQKWRGLEAELKNNQTNNNGIVNIQGQSVGLDQQINIKDATMSSQDQFQQQIQIETISCCTSRRQEDERMRVVDIVRKLANNNNQGANDDVNQECKSLLCPSFMSLKIGFDIRDQQGVFAPVISSPKLRGRQAIADLFNRLEKDRYKEVQELRSRLPVSKFPQRGRIQSLLRYKFLRREVCTQNEKYLQLSPKKRDSKKSDTISTINYLREKYNTMRNQDLHTVNISTMDVNNMNQEKEKAATIEETCKQNAFENDTKFRSQEDKFDFSTDKQLKESNCSIENNTHQILVRDNPSYNQTTDQVHISDQEQNDDDDRQSTNKKPTSLDCCNENEVTCQNVDIISTKATQIEFTSSNNVREDDTNEMKDGYIPTKYIEWDEEREEEALETEEEVAEVEEEECDTDEVMLEQDNNNSNSIEPNLDWTIDIARPRSYWEDLRQTWYQEIFTTRSHDEEIRQLLERGSVSSVLASDFRERMDRLVMSNVERVFHSTEIEEDQGSFRFIDDVENHQHTIEPNHHHQHHQVEVENIVCDHAFDSDIEQHQGETDDDNDDVEIEEDNEREEATTSPQKYHNTNEDYDQTMSSSQYPWIHYHDREISDDSDNVASTSVQQLPRYHSYYHDTHQGPSVKNISSIDMELIFDLKAHMQQLHIEMAELRKSITSCMDMQVKLQQSISEGIPTMERGQKKKPSARHTNKESCCICLEKPIDSLLYKCGHMCTCFNCANELQWSSAKCPKCQTSIIDVVRIYADA